MRESSALYWGTFEDLYFVFVIKVFLVAHFNNAEMIAKQVLSYTSVVGAGELCESDGQEGWLIMYFVILEYIMSVLGK